MEAIAKSHSEITQGLSDLRAQVCTFQGSAEVEIKSLKDEVESTKKKQWILTYVVVPCMSILHATANHFGIKV